MVNRTEQLRILLTKAKICVSSYNLADQMAEAFVDEALGVLDKPWGNGVAPCITEARTRLARIASFELWKLEERSQKFGYKRAALQCKVRALITEDRVLNNVLPERGI